MICRACGAEVPPEAPACPECACPVEEPLPFPLGKVLEDRYRVESVAGRGGMGVVYRGTDLTLNRPVAVKVMVNADPAILARFMREARSLAKVEHRGLVPVYAVGREEGVFYMVMKFIEGQTLSDRLKEGTLEPEALRRILIDTADALWTLHRAELIHRDIKPGNLIIGPDGRVTIMDLGIVKSVGEQTTAQMLGTPKYMPPEMLTNTELDGRADLYALGVIAYQAIEGEVPFDAPTPMGILFKHAHEPPPPFTVKIPKDLSKVILKLMAKSPDQRFKDAEALIAALSSGGVGAASRRPPWRSRAIVGWVLAAAVGITAFALWPRGEAPPPAATEDAGAKVISVTGLGGPQAPIVDAAPTSAPTVDAKVAAARPPIDAGAPPPPPPPPPPPLRQVVRVTTQPPGAKVTLNGYLLGRTPLDVRRPERGHRLKLRLSKSGYAPRWLHLDFKQQRDVRVTLNPAFELLP